MIRLRISNQTAASASSNRKESLQHLDNIKLETSILLQKIKQGLIYLHAFVGDH